MKKTYDDIILKAYQATNSAKIEIGLESFDTTLHKQMSLATEALRIAYAISLEQKTARQKRHDDIKRAAST